MDTSPKSKFSQIIGGFVQEISSYRENHAKIVPLRLRPGTILAVAGAIKHDGKIVIIQPDTTKTTLATLQALAEKSPQSWHLLDDELSEQELSGDIVTALSKSYHALLGDNKARLLIPRRQLLAKVPDPAAYAKNSLAYTTGEKARVSDVIEQLVARGFTRHKDTVEPGSIRVRGEIIDISHPAWNYTIRLLFDGAILERIQHTQDQRTSEISRITVPPVSFPAPTMHVQETLQDALSLQPSDLHIAVQTAIYTDSATPGLTLSESSEASIAAYIASLAPMQLIQPVSHEDALEFIGKLEIGKPAVHADHGIGIFEGLQKRKIDTTEKEYIVLRYAQGDAVSVPIEFAHKVTPYMGNAAPTVHRLHGTAWKKARKAAQHDAVAFAKELLRIASTRSDSSRAPYTLLPEVDSELESSFPHNLTPDQMRTWQEVKHDLTQDIPMDRLVIGDVGFGKTEIAYRAARHVLASGKQVAILAPTTLLVQQHFDLFSSRVPKSAGSVHILSRFTDPKNQRATKQAIGTGEAGIVVGTHALLSPKLEWKNLGLVVVDEEQRFGVKQKEQFKKVRANTDVLSLSATPIPRTLSMALSGLRKLSLITTPPTGRKQVETFVGRFSETKLQEAVSRELDRGGQVYIVAPKIRQLAGIKHTVATLFPEASLEIAHSKLDDDTLADIVHRFDSGQTQILVSSSIVEHGLDLPNANTMIVMHAPHFGLSDLYQLRGRIGRRKTQGYAYFFYTQHKLTSIQRQRLTALTEASRLGSGWELARRDLEIRGAGNLLGAEQSGSVNAVGVQLYLDMVREAKSGEIQDTERADITLPFTTLLPSTYIDNPEERTKWYIRLTRASSLEEIRKRSKELEDTHGELPQETKQLLQSITLQFAATRVGIQKIHTVKVTPPDEDPYDRLVVDTTRVPEVLQLLAPIGNWRLRGSSLTWDTNEITPEIVANITDLLLKDTLSP